MRWDLSTFGSKWGVEISSSPGVLFCYDGAEFVQRALSKPGECFRQEIRSTLVWTMNLEEMTGILMKSVRLVRVVRPRRLRRVFRKGSNGVHDNQAVDAVSQARRFLF